MQNRDTIQTLRQQYRQARRALTAEQQRRASQGVACLITQSPWWQDAQQIAAYLAFDGEIDLMPLINSAWEAEKQIYLPIISPEHKALSFQRFTVDTPMQPNRFNIDEPVFDSDQCINLMQLDVLLVPLVGFDRNANRIGMGGGFYDTTLAMINGRKQRPALYGVAHNCQECPAIESQPWDVQMDCIYTDQKIFPS